MVITVEEDITYMFGNETEYNADYSYVEAMTQTGDLQHRIEQESHFKAPKICLVEQTQWNHEGLIHDKEWWVVEEYPNVFASLSSW